MITGKQEEVAAVIVTHDSAAVLPACIRALRKQTRPVDVIVLVDSGSTDLSYLDAYRNEEQIHIIFRDNIGFSAANNLGAMSLPNTLTHLLFLNPDTFIEPDFIEKGLEFLGRHDDVGVITGKMAGFDPIGMTPTGLLDSTGVFRKWYGRWFDRGQGEPNDQRYDQVEFVPAICGALMFCRIELLRKAVRAGQIFDSRFFMYKEDIELSLRLRRNGINLLYHPELRAYHCRGWKAKRCEVSFEKKMLSARNELLLYRQHFSPYFMWALLKYVLVRFFRI